MSAFRFHPISSAPSPGIRRVFRLEAQKHATPFAWNNLAVTLLQSGFCGGLCPVNLLNKGVIRGKGGDPSEEEEIEMGNSGNLKNVFMNSMGAFDLQRAIVERLFPQSYDCEE